MPSCRYISIIFKLTFHGHHIMLSESEFSYMSGPKLPAAILSTHNLGIGLEENPLSDQHACGDVQVMASLFEHVHKFGQCRFDLSRRVAC